MAFTCLASGALALSQATFDIWNILDMERPSLVCFCLITFLLCACTSDTNAPAMPPPAIAPVTVVTKASATHSSSFSQPTVTGLAAELLVDHAPRNAIERARNATVFIDSGFGTGSGFFLDDSCTIVTNAHVVHLDFDAIKELKTDQSQLKAYFKHGSPGRKERDELQKQLTAINKAADSYDTNGDASEIRVSFVNGREVQAKLIARSTDYDLAYLKIKEVGCPFLEQDSTLDQPLGYKVFTIGNPAGMKYTATSGIVSGYADHDGISFIQTDAAINPGNSGGPLIDPDGRLLGVNTMILSRTEGIGFSLPTQTLLEDFQALSPAIEKYLLSVEWIHWEPKSYGLPSDEQLAADRTVMLDSVNQCIEEFGAEEWGVAIEECQLAADMQHPVAAYLLARMLINDSDRRTRKEAVNLFKRSHEAGFAEATYWMALLIEDGRFHDANHSSKVMALYQEACEEGVGDACNAVGLLYYNAHQHDNAAEQFDLGAKYGSGMSLYSKAYMLSTGKGIAKDVKKAHELYTQAAMQGINYAHSQLFLHYYNGTEVKKDYTTAYMWTLVAEKDPKDDVKSWEPTNPGKARFTLVKLLSREQKHKAEAQVAPMLVKIQENKKIHNAALVVERKRIAADSVLMEPRHTVKKNKSIKKVPVIVEPEVVRPEEPIALAKIYKVQSELVYLVTTLAPAKMAITEHYMNTGNFNVDENAAALDSLKLRTYKYIDDYELEDDGSIIVALNDFFGVDRSLRVWPEVLGSGGINRWYCETNIDQRYITVGNSLCDFNAMN